jgi:cytochrome P450
VVTPILTQEALERFGDQMRAFVGCLRALFEERRAAPRDDLITALL